MKVVQCGRSHSVTAAFSLKQGVNFVLLLRLVENCCGYFTDFKEMQMTLCTYMAIQFYSILFNTIHTTIFSGLSFHVHVLLLCVYCLD